MHQKFGVRIGTRKKRMDGELVRKTEGQENGTKSGKEKYLQRKMQGNSER